MAGTGGSARALVCPFATGSSQRLYGLDRPLTEQFGRRCLRGRRLVERGARFVQVYSGGGHSDQNWHPHPDVNKDRELHCGATDQPIAALLTHLKRPRLLDETLIVWAGEVAALPPTASTWMQG